ncbi:unnamed protein product [Leuciscus chuanchicus]
MSTKSLAKELGLIRRRSQSSGAHQSRRKQRFSFLIIIDFESTCWREKNSFRPEISEFTHTHTLSLTHTHTHTHTHSELCDQVDSAPPLHICLSRFVRWLQGLQQERGVAYETDSSGPAPSGHTCAFVTWSDWDLGVCLLYECKRKQLRVPGALKSWIDLRATYKLFYNRKPKGLRGALLDLGIQFTGREHSGLVDARNTALLAWRMVCDGCCLTITKTLQRTLVKARPQRGNICAAPSVCHSAPSVCDAPQTSVCRSAPSVCDAPQTSVCRSAPSVCDDPQMSVCRSAPSVCDAPQTSVCDDPQMSVCRSAPSVCDAPQTSVCRSAPSVCDAPQTSVCRSAPSVCDDPQMSVCRSAPSVCDAPQTSVCRALVSLVTVLSSTNTALGKTSNTALAGLSDTTYDPETPDACWSDGVLLTEEGEEPVALGAEPDENQPIKTTSDWLKPSISCVSTSLFKTPAPVPHKHTHSHTLTHTDPYGPLSRFLGHAPFRVHRDTPPRAPPPSRLRPPGPAAASLSGKRTAPLCVCGRRARRLTVGNGGPNHGRVFFCCPVTRHSCGFFQWESGLITARTPHACRTTALR